MIDQLTENDIGRYVRRISTGEIGKVRKDPGNGWIHPGVVYEWKAYKNDLEFVVVLGTKEKSAISRLEVIDYNNAVEVNGLWPRELVKYGISIEDFSFQDDNKTLKIFIPRRGK